MTEPRAVAEAVEGYRMFLVRGRSLFSTGVDYEWTPGKNVAGCDKAKSTKRKVWANNPDGPGVIENVITGGHGRIPAWGCVCGFWSYKSQWACRERGPGSGTVPPHSTGFGDFGHQEVLVMGKVANGGRVVVGTDGYRSEFSKVVALVTDIPQEFESALQAYAVSAVPPLTKAEEGISEGWVTRYDPAARPLTMTVFSGFDEEPKDDEDGDFLVDPGSRAHAALLRLRPGVLVRFQFRRVEGRRWVDTIVELEYEEEQAP